MSDIILKAENISKQYRLGTVGTGTLSHDLNRAWHKIRGKEDPYLTVGAVNDRSATASSDYVWALRAINFEVKRGEILGIIGKNGAGKSTLLKILSRVTSPTTGSIKTKGRIASLLEVGTGMHPELTGRENIFLNGAILGMTKAEIGAKIEEIVEFSGCQMYIDTPVKRYSSGMRVRLGFAVAAFLEPDILVVDEVLAVGDAEFQKKAIGKMQDISTTSGRTVLFVSHNMAAVRRLCTRIILLEHGNLTAEGRAEDIIARYFQADTKNTRLSEIKNRTGNQFLSFEDVRVYGKDSLHPPSTGAPLHFEFTIKNNENRHPEGMRMDLRIDDTLGQQLIWLSSSLETDLNFSEFDSKIIFKIPQNPLVHGEYLVTLYLEHLGLECDLILDAFKFQVTEGYFYDSSLNIPKNQGKVFVNYNVKLK